MRQCLGWLIAAGTLLTCAADLNAQTSWPVGVEASLGVTRGGSNNNDRYRGSHAGILADILIGLRLHDPDSGGGFVAVAGAYHGVNLVRTSDCRLAPDGSCMPWFPEFGTVSLLLGWESQSAQFRVLGGPALANSDFRKTLGIVSRVDVGMPLVWRASLLGSVNTLVIPSWNDDRFFYVAGGIGLRIR